MMPAIYHWWKCQSCGSTFPMATPKEPRRCKTCKTKHGNFAFQCKRPLGKFRADAERSGT